MFEFSFNVSPCQVEPRRGKRTELSSKINCRPRKIRHRDLGLWRLLCGWLIVAKHGIPRHATMGHDQGVEALPPGEVSPFTADKSYHLEHVTDLRLSERRFKSGHHTRAFCDYFADLAVAFLLHGIAKVRRARGERCCEGAVPCASRSMATEAALSIEQIHALIAPAGGQNEQEKKQQN
jgi:hypothetical protein